MINGGNFDYMTEAEFAAALATTHPGKSFVYFAGRNLATAKIDSPVLCMVSRLALEASERGDVILVQKRVSPQRYQYMAVKLRKPAKEPMFA